MQEEFPLDMILEVDPFMKLALGTADGHVIETVRIPLERAGRFSVCVSSQVGCALACAFCATGRLGLSRNLETWEMVEQVRCAGVGDVHAPYRHGDDLGPGGVDGGARRGEVSILSGADD